jgi:hypothetical protein
MFDKDNLKKMFTFIGENYDEEKIGNVLMNNLKD